MKVQIRITTDKGEWGGDWMYYEIPPEILLRIFGVLHAAEQIETVKAAMPGLSPASPQPAHRRLPRRGQQTIK